MEREKTYGECHAHIFMDGENYRRAAARHKNGPDETWVRKCLKEYQDAGIRFIREGGDPLGVSVLAKKIAPEYGIDYRTPVFAIHKEGHYGSIVGKSFGNLKEYHCLVLEAAAAGADFIKIMTTGLMDFKNHGAVTGTPLDASEVKEMVHIAHEEGFAVMSHTNGIYGVRSVVEAGVDSVEHGNYMDAETIRMLADSHTVWVPTLVTVRSLLGSGRFPDDTLLPIVCQAEDSLRMAFECGVKTAVGSDAGAYRVFHGTGALEETRAFFEILGDSAGVRAWMDAGETEIRGRFCHK